MEIDNELYVVFQVHPLEIYHFDFSTNKLTFFKKIEYDGRPIRGGTSFVRHENYYYSICHWTHTDNYHTCVLLRVSDDFTKLNQYEIKSKNDLYNKGVLDPLSIYKKDCMLFYFTSWNECHNFYTTQSHCLLSKIIVPA